MTTVTGFKKKSRSGKFDNENIETLHIGLLLKSLNTMPVFVICTLCVAVGPSVTMTKMGAPQLDDRVFVMAQNVYAKRVVHFFPRIFKFPPNAFVIFSMKSGYVISAFCILSNAPSLYKCPKGIFWTDLEYIVGIIYLI